MRLCYNWIGFDQRNSSTFNEIFETANVLEFICETQSKTYTFSEFGLYWLLAGTSKQRLKQIHDLILRKTKSIRTHRCTYTREKDTHRIHKRINSQNKTSQSKTVMQCCAVLSCAV